jgi:hypothetical protein
MLYCSYAVFRELFHISRKKRLLTWLPALSWGLRWAQRRTNYGTLHIPFIIVLFCIVSRACVFSRLYPCLCLSCSFFSCACTCTYACACADNSLFRWRMWCASCLLQIWYFVLLCDTITVPLYMYRYCNRYSLSHSITTTGARGVPEGQWYPRCSALLGGGAGDEQYT